ncbi:MAG: glycosyltransferase family 2 protein [bacterium]|nr:glycosyltransferase family 2 protein [bacterium]
MNEQLPTDGTKRGPITKISFVIPVYNEEKNLEPLCLEITEVASQMGHPHEILLVDDGSSDGSLTAIRRLGERYDRIGYIALTENMGQSAALYAGFQHASGDVVITMDGDLQNDPADIPGMLAHYGDYDMVTGWRQSRRDGWSKRAAGRMGNAFRNLITGDVMRDTGCSLKIMNGPMVRRIKLFKGMHRFLPTLMRLEGARVLEMKVNHRPRLHGHSKYGNLQRGIEGFFDVFVVRWMMRKNIQLKIRERHVDK